MTPQDLIAETLQMTKALTARYLAGFDDTSSVAQAPTLPNHPRWCLGHCALTMHRVAEKLDGKPVPESDFASAPRVPGKYFAESVAFGSAPGEDAQQYPPLSRCVEIYNAAIDRLAAAARAAPEAKLLEEVSWVTFKMPLYLLVVRMCFHNGFHTGQISDLRRALGFKSVFA